MKRHTFLHLYTNLFLIYAFSFQLETVEREFLQLDQKKYANLAKIISEAAVEGRKRLKEIAKKAKHMTHILEELLHSHEHQHKSSSAAPTLLSSLWSRMTVGVIFIHYGLQVFRF